MGACIAPARTYATGDTRLRGETLTAKPFPVQNDSGNGSATELVSALASRCPGLVNSPQHTHLETVMNELREGPYATLFSAHPDLLLSNRAAVICTGEFVPGEVVGNYSVMRSLPTGTVGRSFLVRALPDERGRGRGGVVGKAGGPMNGENSPCCQLRSSTASQSLEHVFKVVTFVTRMKLAERVLDDHKVLTNLIHDNVLRCVDVLDDGQHENFVFVTPYVENGSCEALAGKIKSKDQLLSLLHDVAVGLRVLHSHRIYHHNLKLDNIFIKKSGTACVADAGFGHIFASQSSERLVFNGELACIPPEVFQNDGFSEIDPFKVDVWGFGLLMYRLAYGREPLDVEGKPYGTIQDSVLHEPIAFPDPDWVSDARFQEVVLWCLDRDPTKRPSIMQVLRHPLFGDNMIHSLTGGPISHSGAVNCCYGGQGGSSVNLSVIGARYSRCQKRGGLPISYSLGKGRSCESFVVNSNCNMSKDIVLKVMRRPVLKETGSLPHADMILRDLAFCRVARHPKILHLLEIVENKDGCFATQLYVKGEFLSMKFPPLTNSEDPNFTVKGMLVDVLKGLHFLHTNGVSHLCLMPANIFYQKDTGFVLADFGPLFLTREEALTGGGAGSSWYSVPPWVLEDLKEPLRTTTHAVDTFCVGLLAASALPVVCDQVWQSFCSGTEGDTIVQRVIEKVEASVDVLTPPLVEFIIKAVTAKAPVMELLSHPYLADMVDVSQLPCVERLRLSPAAIQSAVSREFTFREEHRLMDVLGRDPMLESALFGTSMLVDSIVHEESAVSMFSPKNLDSSVVLPFKNKIVCGLCHATLTIVVFRCPVCALYIRCGKCALSDNHGKEHEMVPYLIHTIEHKGGGNQEALLLPPSSIQNSLVLEEVEMQANLPVGSLQEVKCSSPLSTGGPVGLLKAQCRNRKKKVLPKASEIDDLSWEEEIASCREKCSPELLLYRFDLTSVPKEVFDPPLLHLVSVDLSYNKLTSIPHELSFLHKLRSLVIAYNQLSELPDSLGNLSLLERLDVSHNHLQQLPQSFMYLSNLATLSMDYNDFSGIPESVVEMMTISQSMAMLSVIYLAENPRITAFPKREVLEQFPKLKLALDNEPNVYRTYISEKLEEELPNVSMMWNKIYPDRIVEHVYCGSLRSAQSQLVYEKLSIKSLLTMGRDLVPTPPIGGRHLTLSIDDIEGANIRLTFQESVDFIDGSVKEGKGCLVHCFSGMSRSATTVIAYLMMKRGMRLDEAYCKIKEGRPVIYPNEGFFKQLVQLDAELFPQQRSLNMAVMQRDNAHSL